MFSTLLRFLDLFFLQKRGRDGTIWRVFLYLKGDLVMKKLIVLFLTLCMLLSLNACGGSGKNSGAAATQAPVATPALATPPARN